MSIFVDELGAGHADCLFVANFRDRNMLQWYCVFLHSQKSLDSCFLDNYEYHSLCSSGESSAVDSHQVIGNTKECPMVLKRCVNP